MANDPSMVRAWALARGFTVAEGGRLPAAVVAAYEAAHPADDDGGGEPDWTGAPDAGEDDGTPGPAVPPPPGPGPGPGAGPGEGPPPPADMDEAKARVAREARPRKAAPRWAGGSRKRGGQRKPEPVPKTVQADIEGKLALLLAVPVNFWAAVDPVCGGAALEALDQTVRKAVPLICQSAQLVKWFSEGTIYLLWLDLVLALQPVGMAYWRHHVTGTLMAVNGRVVQSRRLTDGRIVPAGMAPDGQASPPPDYSAYTVPGHVPPVPAAA